MLEQRFSDNDVSRRDIPSFIEPRPPLIQNPFMRPRPQKGTNLLELFEEDSEIEEPELVQVYLRLKPCKVPNTLYEVRSDRCLVTSLDTATAGHGRRTQHNVSKMYTFSKIFGAECNQKEIFEAVVKDNLKKLPDGQNFTLLTYGASGSGKTYTLMGTVGAPGLVPRSLEYVFRLVEAAQQPAFRPAENGAEKLSHAEQDYEIQWVKRLRHVSAPLRDKYRRMSVQLHSDLTVSSIDLSNRIRHYVWVSFVEIYNEAIYDLLAPPEKRTKLRIREDSSGNVYVKGATQAFVRSGEEAYDVMVAGKHNLVVAATGVHAQSSRSHCIFTITMLTEAGDGSVRTSYVRLCDLAGCERARATRNTGARMAESRAINSSLHVLERCLHMLRRKQKSRNDALVPYRESKLTRLLGTGLSGARGEAVSMVVTLNPSPEYAHETKHVLTLAAVAQDIQINNTMLASTLESSTQDTTISCSSEVMKLRADNERLHFELLQAQARNKELMAAMEERQQESANTMRELVEEAKDLTKQYYEAQLEALRCEMEDMVEEYESKLVKVSAHSTSAGTPSRILQSKVTQLMTEIAVLEEKLTAESLARSRAEKEVQHLRTCIEERDEKGFKDKTPPRENVMSLSDSEQESDEDTDDPFNESLEPIFKKELNRSLAILNEKRENATIHTMDYIDEKCDTNLDETHETLKNDDVESKNSTYDTGEDEDNELCNKNSVSNEKIDDVTERFDDCVKTDANVIYNNKNTHERQISLKNDANDVSDEESHDLTANNDESFKNVFSTSSKIDLRGTYFISDCNITGKDDFHEDANNKKTNSFRGTYFVKEPLTDVSKTNESQQDVIVNSIFKEPIIREKSKVDTINVPEARLKTDESKNITDKLVVDLTDPGKKSVSLLTKISPEKSEVSIKPPEEVLKPQIDKIITEKPDFDLQEQGQKKVNMTVTKKVDMLIREKSNVDLKVTKLEASNIIRAKTSVDIKVPEKLSGTLVGKIINSLKSKQSSDSSLRQFEQLEKASKECNDDPRQKSESGFGDVKMLKEKRTYFENVLADDNSSKSRYKKEPVLGTEKRTYFDNIDVNIEVHNKKINEINQIDDERSPSIVKDIVSDNFEPSTIKKLLGDSFTKLDAISSIPTSRSTKKHNSVDIFDGFDSPLAPKTTHNIDNIEMTVQSIEKLVLDQGSDDKYFKTCSGHSLSLREDPKPEITEVQIDIKKEMKLEPMSSIEESNEVTAEYNNKTNLEGASSIDEPNQTMNETQAIAKEDNTMEEFENIYKDITAPRATEFDLLVSQVESIERNDKDEAKYNLRKKQCKTNDDNKVNKHEGEEILAVSHAKCESKIRKRPLRLRRKKNQDDDSDEKLRDIVNLQSEFSDVTLDVPTRQKVVKDIPSPEKGAEENLPPLLGIQSCPSKSVTRSRRKLFTPRAEPLEESLSQTGDSNERIYVPRPSYHRPRARRKL